MTKIINQEKLLALLLPEIKKANQQYEKYKDVHVRKAKEGEAIATITSSGLETENIAKAHDYVIKNLTDANEQYLLSQDNLGKKYQEIAKVDGQWSLYKPLGKVLGIEVTHDTLALLNIPTDSFEIMASWGSEQRVNIGDILASPIPELNKIYRIDIKEFYETYKLLD